MDAAAPVRALAHRRLTSELLAGRGAGRPASAEVIGCTSILPRTIALAI